MTRAELRMTDEGIIKSLAPIEVEVDKTLTRWVTPQRPRFRHCYAAALAYVLRYRDLAGIHLVHGRIDWFIPRPDGAACAGGAARQLCL